MPWETSVFPLLIVVSGPPFTGLFVYSPAPGAGNLVASITASAGTDPYGNHYNPGITSYDNTFGGITNILGAVIRLFAGVTERALLSPGHFTVFNSSGATIYDIDLARAAQFLYADTGSATQGALVASQSQNSGTDQFGNIYQAGVTAYGSPGGLASVAELVNGLLQTGTPGQIAGAGGASPGQLGLITGVPGVVRVDSGLTATGDLDAFVDVRSTNAQASINAVAQRNIQLAGPLALSSEGSKPAQLFTALVYDNGSGFPRMEPGASNDTNAYAFGRFVPRVASPGILINSVAFTNIPVVFNVAAGTYRIHAMISLVSTFNAGAANLQLNGSATVADMSVVYWNTAKNAASSVNCTRIAALATVIPSVTFAASEEYIMLDGFITFSGAGTFAVQMSCTVAADTYTVITDSFVELMPT